MHVGAQADGVPFGDADDQVGGAGQGEGGGKAGDHGYDLPRQAERFQGFIDGALVEPAPGNVDVPAGRIPGRGDLALAQRVAGTYDADEAVAEQGLGAQLGAGVLADDAGFQVDAAGAQRRAVFVWLLHKAQAYARRLLCDARNQRRTEVFGKAFAAAQGEGSHQLLEVDLRGGAQHRFGVLHQLRDALAQFQRSGRRHQAAPGPDQQRIAHGFAQARQCPAHCRGAQPQALGGARHAAFGEQHIEGDQQIEIGCGHLSPPAWRDFDKASSARITCKCCAFRQVTRRRRFLTAPFRELPEDGRA
ncbi:hypothetical protein D3C86_1482680 [compost metagenome]